MNTNMQDREFCRKYHKEQVKYTVNAVSRRVIKSNIFEQHYDRKVLSEQDGNELLYQALVREEAFMAGRFGGNEIRTISDVLFEKSGGRLGGLSARTRYKITNQAGFFPDEIPLLYQFEELYLECCKQVDVLGTWNMFLQAEIAKRYLPKTQLCELRTMEPFYFTEPWSRALAGKNVLVIHPFSESIQKQYERRDKIFENPQILPDFSLKTVKAVQTIAGSRDSRFSTWFEALDSMFEEAIGKEFEIALIGCGAYGFPLAAKLKKAGKKVIHMGGALQLLFGIKGKRWDKHEFIAKLYNESWIRPSEAEMVRKANVVEGGCYW